MAKQTQIGLPLDTIIEVIRQNKDKSETLKKEMTFGEWLSYPRLKDHTYLAFQKGFSQFKLTKK